MSKSIQAVRGMNDILPNETFFLQNIENILRKTAASYGYQEIRFPILEYTELFIRTIGETTDIVEKEMYTFADRNGDSLTLRPEGTASCVRAGIEHGLLYNQTQRLFYLGPMFRYERPQKGRYRQFYQFGVEAFGFKGPDIDAEILLLVARIWEALHISNKVMLQINSLGNSETRGLYRQKLVNYFTDNFAYLDDDSKKRLVTNPLRILDSKNPNMQELIKNAPEILQHLDAAAKSHFDGLRKILDKVGLEYVVNPRLVRGLDYYCLTVFEWVTNELGAQNAVCAGGHYDNLVAELGGKSTPAMGYAIGLERIGELVKDAIKIAKTSLIYVVLLGEHALYEGMVLVEQLRCELVNMNFITNCGGGDLSTQLKRADKSGADIALIIGDEELAKRNITLKYLRKNIPQLTANFTAIVTKLALGDVNE